MKFKFGDHVHDYLGRDCVVVDISPAPVEGERQRYTIYIKNRGLAGMDEDMLVAGWDTTRVLR